MAQLKRLAAPKFWPIERKVKKFIAVPSPGPHPASYSMPLGVLLRDVLKCVRTMKEANLILGKGFVRVDGITRKSKNFPIGLMDVVCIGKDFYRVVPHNRSLRPRKI
ncbi:MAG: 30S ribosomal protein S4e, partial [Candidatus Aenigmarchaeota archaeon]|nr:30S ribosomal protein S4e [Candidatus Aenigmarchaeota archaeon]MDI6722031.1 30S ribosomal protein S4e [Candidatus Aenigmarchaeota archaeon]